MMEIFKKYCAAAIREDKGERRILYVDPADYNTQHIFFDAKCGFGDDCRISVRDIITGNEIPYKDAINKYIAFVETHRAVSEPDYFMKLIEMCEYTRDEEIEMRESGKLEEVERQKAEVAQIAGRGSSAAADSVEDHQEPLDEWEKLQNIPHDQYLIQTIMPVLYQGLKVVAVERPK